VSTPRRRDSRIQRRPPKRLFLHYRDFEMFATTLLTKVGGRIEIVNVTVPLGNYDEATGGRTACKTAEAEAKANCWPDTTAAPTVPAR